MNSKLYRPGLAAKAAGCLFFVLLWLCQPRLATADLLWLVGQEEPVSGVLVEENEVSVRFRYTINDVEKLVDVERSKIKELVVTLDQQRLATLSPQDVTMYLDYAEELAGFSKDRYAIETAQHMALIAARLSVGQQRSSAFRLLISLCDGDDKRNVERLAFLYDPAMALPKTGVTADETIDATAKETLIELIRMIRRGQGEDAIELAEQERIIQLVEPLCKLHATTCNLGELRVAANAERLTIAQLAKLLQLEHALLSENPTPARNESSQSWFAASSEVVESNQMLPEFENVLGIDTRQSIFRDGVWVAPSVDP